MRVRNRPLRRADHVTIGFILLTVLVGWVLGRRLWFYADDWNIIASYHNGRLLEPFNSHLSLVPAGIYQTLFHGFGLGSYVPYRLVGLAAYAVLGLATLRYVRERLGGIGSFIAVAAVLWNAGASTSLMFPFLMNYSVPLAAMAAIWWHFDQATPHSDWWASAWLTVALATSGMGLLCVVAVGTELVFTRAARRRWLVMSPGPVLWLAWYAFFGESNPPLKNVGRVASDSLEIIWGGFASLVGGSKPLGLLLAALFCGVVALSALRWKTFTARAFAGCTAMLAFAVLTAISFNREHAVIRIDEPRYTWTVGVFLVFTCMALVPRGGGSLNPAAERDSSRKRPVLTAGLVLAAIALAFDVGITIRDSQRWTDSVTLAAPGVRDNLAAAEEAERYRALDPSRILPLSFNPVTAAEYIDAVHDVGSPLEGSSRGDFGGSQFLRRTADQTLEHDFGFTLERRTTPMCHGTRWSTGAKSVSGAMVEITAGNETATLTISRFTTPDDAQISRAIAAGETVSLLVPRVEYGPKYQLIVNGDFQGSVCG